MYVTVLDAGTSLPGIAAYQSARKMFRAGVDTLIEEHVDARDSGVYDDEETVHWGRTHIESWK